MDDPIHPSSVRNGLDAKKRISANMTPDYPLIDLTSIESVKKPLFTAAESEAPSDLLAGWYDMTDDHVHAKMHMRVAIDLCGFLAIYPVILLVLCLECVVEAFMQERIVKYLDPFAPAQVARDSGMMFIDPGRDIRAVKRKG
jgi:hypothetical protein